MHCGLCGRHDEGGKAVCLSGGNFEVRLGCCGLGSSIESWTVAAIRTGGDKNKVLQN